MARSMFLAAAVFIISTVLAAGSDSGVVIYTTTDHGQDEIAIALPFVKVERHPLVTNVTTAEGKVVRVTNNQLKQLLRPTDLTQATVVDNTGLHKLRVEAEKIRLMQEQYPRAKSALDPHATEIERMVQVLGSGNVLLKGRLMSLAAYQSQMAAAVPETMNLTIGGRSYTGAKLSSVRGGVVSIQHSGGVAAVSVDQLSNDQIVALNGTSSGPTIDRSRKLAGTPAGTPMSATTNRTTEGQTSAPDDSAGHSGDTAGNKRRTSSIGAMPDIYTVAELLHSKQQEAARRLAQNGRRFQPRSARDIASQTENGVGEFLAYDIGALVAANVIDNFANEDGLRHHRGLMEQLARARTAKEAGLIKRQMKENAQKYYTGDIEQLHAYGATEEGRIQLTESMSKIMTRSLTHVAFLQETRYRQGVQVEFRAEQAGITSLSADQMLDFHTKFDLLTRMDIAAALQSGIWDGVDLSILGGQGAMDAFRKFLQAADRKAGGRLGKQLDTYNTYAAADPTLSNSFSEMDERDYYERVIPRMIEEAEKSSMPTENDIISGATPEKPAAPSGPNRYDTGDPKLERRLIESDKIQSKIFDVPEDEMIRMRKAVIETMVERLGR